jgi:hypothetical protein
MPEDWYKDNGLIMWRYQKWVAKKPLLLGLAASGDSPNINRGKVETVL